MIIISRVYQPDCTVGVLNYKDFRCCTLELPDKGNAPNISCIPAGLYRCRKVKSDKYGVCVEVRDVVGRTLIRIHWGNFTRDIRGCIVVGDSIKDIDRDGILDVTNSKATFKRLMAALPDTFNMKVGA